MRIPSPRNRRGAAVVEFALLLPFLMALFLIIGDQKDQFAAADANRVAVAQQLAADWNPVYECTVVAIEINQMESDVRSADGEMPAGHGAIAQAKIIGRIPSDGKLFAFQADHRALGWP